MPAYTTDQVIQAHVGPHTQDGFYPNRNVNDANESLLDFIAIHDGAHKPVVSKKLSLERASYLAKFVLPFIWQNYTNLTAACKSLSPGMNAFASGILGPDASKPHVHVSYPELHRRMLLADEAFGAEKLMDKSTNRPNANHAKAWQVVNTAMLDKRQILIDACGAWFPHLQRLTSVEYLDVLAGVITRTPSSFQSSASKKEFPAAAAATLQTEAEKTQVEHVQLKADGGSGRSLGSVFHLQNCFSPSFVDHAMKVGIPSLPFMRDGMKPGKDRLSRIASQAAGTPFSLRTENPYLMLSDVTLSFEADMLKVGNFLNAHLHAHLKSYVAEHHGKKAVDLVVPPLVVFDLLQSSLNSLSDGGYAAHDDSGNFVTDNNLNYGDEDHNMLVVTFFWTNRQDVPTNVTWVENGRPKNKSTIATRQGGAHFQTFGVQGNKKHYTEPPTRKQKKDLQPPIAINDHRLAQSLRSTERFQSRHHSLISKAHPKILSVGDPTDYNFKIVLGQPKEKNSLMGTAIRPNESSAKTTAEARQYFTPRLLEKVRCITDEDDMANKPDSGNPIDGPDHDDSDVLKFLDVKTAKFVAPVENYSNYPTGHDRYLKSPHAPHSFFSCGAGLRHLHQERISPIVYMTDPLVSPELARQVNYGMLMEHLDDTGTPRPVAPGRVFSAAAVYKELGLSSSITDSQVWNTDSESLIGAIFSKMYKSEFPGSTSDDRGPIQDYRRLLRGQQRQGFWTGGAGGAAELVGQVAPDLQKPSSLEAAILEQPQKVFSIRNMSMLQAAERKAWLQIYAVIGRHMIPEKEVDYSHPCSKPLEKSSMPKVVYLGCYEIDKVTYEQHEIIVLQQLLAFQDALPPDSPLKLPSLDSEFKRFLRFRSEMHFQFYLRPVELKDGDTCNDWRYLRLSKQDPRRIQILIPPDVALNSSLSLGPQLISVEQVYEDWVHRDRLFVNFLSLRDNEGDCESEDDESANSREGGDEDSMHHSDNDDDDQSPVVEHAELQEKEHLTALPEERKRVMSVLEAHTVLTSISVGCFCRLLEINVDSRNRIRPLVDPAPDHDFELLNFHLYFVADDAVGTSVYDFLQRVQPTDFLPSLGVTVQRHMFPHPIRVYDVATLYLLFCTGGGHKRVSRKGMAWLKKNITTATDFLLHSIVLRILGKTHALKSWCEFSRKRMNRHYTWFLPGVNEIDDFLEFVHKAIDKTSGATTRKNECCDFTSEQFLRTLDEKFKSHRGLALVLGVWKTAARQILEDFVQREGTRASANPPSNTRETFIRSMVNVFVGAGCKEKGQKLRFVCSQVCADMEELIDGLPFGDVISVCTGPGSKAGCAVFNEVNHVEFMAHHNSLSTDELLMKGLERGEHGTRVIYNKRYLNKVDVEHGCCKIGVYVPKLPGGGGSISVRPRRQAPHCHPVCNTPFDASISDSENKRIKEIARDAVLAFKRAVVAGNWKSPEGILGEQCWKRPVDYLVTEEL
jgi:hypothetical protein